MSARGGLIIVLYIETVDQFAHHFERAEIEGDFGEKKMIYLLSEN